MNSVAPLIFIFIRGVICSGPPEILTDYNPNYNGELGGSLRLPCPVWSDPEPLVSWSKDSLSIHGGWERFKITSSTLRIRNVEESDAGVYVCTAINGFGSVTARLFVSVQGKENILEGELKVHKSKYSTPTFTRLQQMRTANTVTNTGDSLELGCETNGSPLPDIAWFRDGQSLPRSSSGVVSSKKWSLVLNDLKPEDSGVYSCVVWNREGQLSHEYQVIVRAKVIEPSVEACYTSSAAVMVGESATLHCVINSSVRTTVEWLKSIEPYVTQPHNTTRRVLDDQQYTVIGQHTVTSSNTAAATSESRRHLIKLTLPSVERMDSGVYACAVATGRGHSFRSTHLSVNQGKQMLIKKSGDASFSLENSSTSSLAPVIVVLSCMFLLVLLLVVACAIYRMRVCNTEISNTRQMTLARSGKASTASTLISPGIIEKASPESNYALLQPKLSTDYGQYYTGPAVQYYINDPMMTLSNPKMFSQNCATDSEYSDGFNSGSIHQREELTSNYHHLN